MVFRITHVISIVSITCHALITCWLSQLNKNSSSQLTRHYYHHDHPPSQKLFAYFYLHFAVATFPTAWINFVLRAFLFVSSFCNQMVIKVMGWFYISLLYQHDDDNDYDDNYEINRLTWFFIALPKMFEWLIYDHVFPRSLICWLWHRQISLEFALKNCSIWTHYKIKQAMYHHYHHTIMVY